MAQRGLPFEYEAISVISRWLVGASACPEGVAPAWVIS